MGDARRLPPAPGPSGTTATSAASSTGGFSVPSMKPVRSRLSRYTKHGCSAASVELGRERDASRAGRCRGAGRARCRASRPTRRAGSPAPAARRPRSPGNGRERRRAPRPVRARRHRSAPKPTTRLAPPAVTVRLAQPRDACRDRRPGPRPDAGRTRGGSANGCPGRRSRAAAWPPLRLLSLFLCCRTGYPRRLVRVGLDRRARAHHVAVTVRVVDPADRRPVLVGAQRRDREGGDVARVRRGPTRRPRRRRPVCGACRSGLSSTVHSPASTRAISPRMAIIASQNRSSSRFDSDSVGSTISVPATGNDIVGAWKPKSMRRLATSSAVTPVALRDRPQVEDALVGDEPARSAVEHRDSARRAARAT